MLIARDGPGDRERAQKMLGCADSLGLTTLKGWIGDLHPRVHT